MSKRKIVQILRDKIMDDKMIRRLRVNSVLLGQRLFWLPFIFLLITKIDKK